MGIKRSDWILIGVNIGKEYHNDEWYEMDNSPLDKYDENSTVGEITYLYDGMGSKYFIVGEVIQADPNGHKGLKLFEENKINDGDYFVSVERVKLHIKENFGINTEPELIALTHWT
ncbi:hypothetical protein [Metabacillus fastidiosus]|uniref:hypothetical protein n=1 Tax=Metabacillus fastidiosus TaxID=1458 RepID=UPI003D2CE6FF